MPGFDGADERRGLNYFGEAEQGIKLMVDFLDRLGIKKVCLLLHSLGGFFGKLFALKFPHRVDCII